MKSSMKSVGWVVGVPAALGMASGTAAAGQAASKDFVPNAKWDFSGPYIGVTGGVSWLHATADDSSYLGSIWNSYGYGVSGPMRTSDNALGGLLGVTLGYNAQSGNFVYGVEGDISWLGGNSVTTKGSYYASSNGYGYGYGGTSTRKSTVDGLATLRARAGFDVDGTLLYGTGGIAFGHVKDSINYTSGYSSGDSGSHTGWETGFVVGVGLERKLTQRLSLKAEGLWVDLPNDHVAGGYGGAPINFSHQLGIVRVGLDWSF